MGLLFVLQMIVKRGRRSSDGNSGEVFYTSKVNAGQIRLFKGSSDGANISKSLFQFV